jgi:hypothetical protein
MGIKEYFKSLEEAEKVEETVSAAIEDAQTATGTFVGKLKRWFWEILGL